MSATSAGTTKGTRQQPTVLIVDDDPGTLRIAKKSAERYGYTVITATNGEEALSIVRRHQPDAVLTDLAMPELGGHGLVRILRTEFPSLPIVVMSGIGEMDDVIDLLRQRISDYLPKPFRPSQLVAALRSAMESAEQLTPPSATADRSDEPIQKPDPLDSFRPQAFDFGPAASAVQALGQLAGDSGVSRKRVVSTVSASAALAKHVLNLANTAYYRGQRAVSNLNDAAVRLGNRTIVSMAQTISARGLYRSQSGPIQNILTQCWEVALFSARVTRELARYTMAGDPEDAYLAALMAPVGQVALLRHVEDRLGPDDDYDELCKRVSARYSKVSKRLLQQWNMPSLVAFVAEHHLRPGDANPTSRIPVQVAHLVRIGLWAAQQAMYAPVIADAAPLEFSLQAVGILSEDIAALVARVPKS